MATDNSRIAKNTMFLYMRMILSMGISIVTAGVTLRVLGEVDYGLNAVLGGIVAMFSVLNASLSGAASRNITYAIGKGVHEEVNKIFNASLIVFLFMGVIIVVLCETLGLWFFYNKMVIPEERMQAAFWVLQLSIINVPLALTQVPYGAMLIAHEDIKMFATVGIVDQVARLIIIYLLWVSPFDKLVTLSAMHFGWGLVMLLVYRIYCIRRYPETKIKPCKDGGLYKSIFQFAGSDLIGNISWMAQGQGLNLLLNTFFGPAVNAARGIAYGLQGMTSQFSRNFMVAVEPQIVKSFAQEDYEGMWKLVKRSSCFSFGLIWLLALPAWLEADYVLKLWLGSYPEHTISFFRLIVIVCLFEAIRRPLIKVIHATGKVFLGNITVGTILCLSFPAAYICLRLGCEPESVFWCTIGSMVLASMMEWCVLLHYHKYNVLDYFKNVYVRCAAVMIISSVVPMLVYDRVMEPCFIRMILTGILTSISVCITMLYVGMSGNDRGRLLSIAVDKFNQIMTRK